MQIIYHYQRPFRFGRGKVATHQMYNEEMCVWLDFSQTPSVSMVDSLETETLMRIIPQLNQKLIESEHQIDLTIERIYSYWPIQEDLVVRLFTKILALFERWSAYHKRETLFLLSVDHFELGNPTQIATLNHPVLVHSILVDQSPSAEQIGGVTLMLEPSETFSFANGVVLFPEKRPLLHWSGAVKAQIEEIADVGFVEETAVPPLKITLLDLIDHPLDSKERAFQLATRQAIYISLRHYN